jgi:hypothetical protein
VPMPISEKTFLESLTELLPGVRGYRDREGRSETDRRLRGYLAGRLDEARAALRGIRPSPELERTDDALLRSLRSLRAEDPADSGLGPETIGLRDLDRLYAYDELLLDGVHMLVERIRGFAEAGTGRSVEIEALLASAEHLAHAIERRRDVFEIHER